LNDIQASGHIHLGRLKSFPGTDPWREQYFEHAKVPEGVVVPIDDASAWMLYPRQRWVYNKLLICETQGIAHGPHGTMPPHYPIFSKPIYNMRGMGTGSRILASEADYLAAIAPGYLWMELFEGRHVSTDAALEGGLPRWWRHTTGEPAGDGTFDYWTVHAAPELELEACLVRWIADHLQGYSGIVNFETIGGRIIECHLRMAEQWLDLNGPGWLDAVVRLYGEGVWRFDDSTRREGYSVVLFAEHGQRWRIDRQAVARLLPSPGVSSIQITFDDSVAPEQHAMPEGGFRLAIVNAWDLAAGRAMRETLRGMFKAC
jgi:hypothetical protein